MLISRLRNIPTAVYVYGAIALLILGPLLMPGFILTLDMVFTPVLRLPAEVTSTYPLRAMLHALDWLLPAELVQKLLLFIILLLTGWGAHRLIVRSLRSLDGKRTLPAVAPYFGGLLYMVNPYTYERFIAGQYNVLFGYALLPWLLVAALRLGSKKAGKAGSSGWHQALPVTGWLLLIGIVSIHTLGPAFLLLALVLGVRAWQSRQDRPRLLALARQAVIVSGGWLLLNTYWLVLVLLGRGPQARFVASFTEGDRQAFATSGDGFIGQLLHVVRLQGFWPERHGLFILPQHAIPGWLWAAVCLVVLGLVIYGFIALWPKRRGLCAILLGCVVLGAIFAAGAGAGWLAQHVPFFAGYREPHKFAGLVALGYAVAGAAGLAALSDRLSRRAEVREYAGAAGGALLALPFLWAPNYAWAAGGQLQSVSYPDGWYTVNQRLAADRDDFQTLFLPWHMYMYMDFAGRLIMNPAQPFFDKPVMTADDPEMAGAALDASTPAKRQVAALLRPALEKKDGGVSGEDFARRLAELDIKYIILAKDNDYEEYKFLDRAGLRQEYVDSTIVLYRNDAYRP